MRPSALAWLVLLAVNGALFVSGRSVSREHAELSARLIASSEQIERSSSASSEQQRLDELIALARDKAPDEPLGIAPLRGLLFEAERGLAVERSALDFRPAGDLPSGFDGNRIQASFQGSLDGLFGYLARIEAMRLPLSTEALGLRNGGTNVNLAIRWLALWPVDDEAAPEAFPPTEVEPLTVWIDRPPPGNLGRDLFAFAPIVREPEPAPTEREHVAAPTPDVSDDLPREAAPVRPGPELMGFVLARPELEPDVSRRVLAAMRYDDTVRLVKIGDRIGGYVVERIHARESVVLADVGTGERLLLRLK